MHRDYYSGVGYYNALPTKIPGHSTVYPIVDHYKGLVPVRDGNSNYTVAATPDAVAVQDNYYSIFFFSFPTYTIPFVHSPLKITRTASRPPGAFSTFSYIIKKVRSNNSFRSLGMVKNKK